MTSEQKLILDLVCLGIGHGDIVNVPEDIKWDKVFDIAIKQGVVAIALDGAQKSYEKGNPIEIDTMTKFQWIDASRQVEVTYDLHEKTSKKLALFYKRHDIRMLLLKGLGMSINYSIPNHRPCGDLDIYLFGDLKKGDRLVEKELGIKIDHSHHIHTVFAYSGVTVENHYNFFYIYAHPSSKEVDRWMKEKAKNFQGKDGIYLPTSEVNALYIIRHAATHFAAEQITLRHVLDWAFFVDKHYHDVDWKWHWKKCQELNMDKFLLAINDICVTYLGFTPDKFKLGSDKSLTEKILNDIFQPEFDEKNPKGVIAYIHSRFRRWWCNRWKHKIVYPESLLSTFLYQIKAHLMKPATLHI